MKYVVGLFCLSTMCLGSAEIRYNIVNLEALGAPDNFNTQGIGINSVGQASGTYYTPDLKARAFSYSDGVGMQDIGSLGGDITIGWGINDRGQITGRATVAGSTANHGYVYTPGSGMITIGSLGGGDTEAYGINNRGQVTGSSYLDRQSQTEHAFRWSPETGMQDLGSLFGGGSRGWAINTHGQVTGRSDGWNAFLYTDGVGMTYLGPGDGRDINDFGIVVGEGPNGSLQNFEAALYRDGQTFFLGTLGGASSLALGINDLNQVVGSSDNENNQSRAFIWNEGEGMLDLNDLVDPNSGWLLGRAIDINDAGQIVGTGIFNGSSVAFRLDPIPEPSTWALMILGGAGLWLWRRRNPR